MSTKFRFMLDNVIRPSSLLPAVGANPSYRNERCADIMHALAYERSIAPFAEFVARVFDFLGEHPPLLVRSDEEYATLGAYWHN